MILREKDSYQMNFQIYKQEQNLFLWKVKKILREYYVIIFKLYLLIVFFHLQKKKSKKKKIIYYWSERIFKVFIKNNEKL